MKKRLPRYCKQSRKKDPQQNLVYFMEGDALGSLQGRAKMTREDIREMAKQMCKNYQIPPVGIRFKPLEAVTAHWMEPGIIELNSSSSHARGILILLHELAHHLHFHFCPCNDHQDHGPQFMACYMHILDSARTIPFEGMKAICDSYGVKYADLGTKNSLTALKKAVRGYGQNRSA